MAAEQWFLGILMIVSEQLPIEIDWPAWWDRQGHLGYVHRMTLFSPNVVVSQISAPVGVRSIPPSVCLVPMTSMWLFATSITRAANMPNSIGSRLSSLALSPCRCDLRSLTDAVQYWPSNRSPASHPGFRSVGWPGSQGAALGSHPEPKTSFVRLLSRKLRTAAFCERWRSAIFSPVPSSMAFCPDGQYLASAANNTIPFGGMGCLCWPMMNLSR